MFNMLGHDKPYEFLREYLWFNFTQLSDQNQHEI